VDARYFNEFELYWLGGRYEGLELTSMRFTKDGDDVHHGSFFYGEPSYAGDAASGSWLPPLEIDVQPYCGFAPEETESAYGDDFDRVEIRGVVGYLYGDYGLFLWTANSEISISTWKSEVDIVQAARDLIPIARVTGARLNPLPPPTSTEC